jgi:hypothetical protein
MWTHVAASIVFKCGIATNLEPEIGKEDDESGGLLFDGDRAIPSFVGGLCQAESTNLRKIIWICTFYKMPQEQENTDNRIFLGFKNKLHLTKTLIKVINKTQTP